MGEEEEDLQDYSVRLPKEICDKLPIAKITSGKKIQDLIRDALEHYFKRLNP
jgi:predicted DNA-binding protein